MALTMVYDQRKKMARVDGCLALHSVEPLRVENSAGEALEAGTVCLHARCDGPALAEWGVTDGDCMADTRTTALPFMFSGGQDAAELYYHIRDSEGTLLGRGCVTLVFSCASVEGEEPGASGGPMDVEAGVALQAGCPVRLEGGVAVVCHAGRHAELAGIALSDAEQGNTVRVCRWGAAYVSGWGLEAGALYWLAQSGQALSRSAANQALAVGYAQDEDTLILTGGRLAVQPRAAGSGGDWFVAWDAQEQRLIEVEPAVGGGSGSAHRVPRLNREGLLPGDMIPVTPIVTLARQAITDAVRSISTGEAPQYRDVVELLYRLVAALKSAGGLPPVGGTVGEVEVPELRDIIDDTQVNGDTASTWSSSKIIAYLIAQAALAVQVLPDVADVASLPAPGSLERAAICFVASEGTQYWCAGPGEAWQQMEYSGPTMVQMEGAIAAAVEPVSDTVDGHTAALALRYTKSEVDGLLDDKADESALAGYYDKSEVDGLLDDKADGAATTAALGLRYTKSESDTRYGASWGEVDVENWNEKSKTGSRASARARGGLLLLDVELHSYASGTNTIAAGQVICEVDATPVETVVWARRSGDTVQCTVESSGRVVANGALVKSGTSIGNSIPWVISAGLALA